MITIALKGNVPSKKNSKQIICRGSRPMLLPSESYKAWHETQMWILKRFRPPEPLKSVKVEITLYAESARKADLTNKAESIMDLLVDAGILHDDNWFEVGDLHLKFGGIDREDPRALIEITK